MVKNALAQKGYLSRKKPVRMKAIKVQYEMGIYDRFANGTLVNFSACKTII